MQEAASCQCTSVIGAARYLTVWYSRIMSSSAIRETNIIQPKLLADAFIDHTQLEAANRACSWKPTVSAAELQHLTDIRDSADDHQRAIFRLRLLKDL